MDWMNSYTRLRSDSCDRFYAAPLRKSTWHFVFRGFKVAVLFCPWVLGDQRMRIKRGPENKLSRVVRRLASSPCRHAELIAYNYNPDIIKGEHHHEKDHVSRRSFRPRSHGSI